MGDSASLAIMVTTMAAMAKIFIVSLIGVICAKYPSIKPLLPVESLQTLAVLSNKVFLPCSIVTTLGSMISPALLARLSILLFFCFYVNGISYGISIIFAKLFQKHLKTEFLHSLIVSIQVAIMSPNAISLPMMVLQTMCEQSIVNKDYGGDSNTCFGEVNSMLFVYMIAWFFCFWSIGYPILESVQHKNRKIETHETSSITEINSIQDLFSLKDTFLLWIQKVFLTPPMIAIYIGLLIGLSPPLQGMMFKRFSGLRPLGSAIQTLGQPIICINTLVMAASIAQVNFLSLFSRSQQETLAEWMDLLGLGLINKKEKNETNNNSPQELELFSPLHETTSKNLIGSQVLPPSQSTHLKRHSISDLELANENDDSIIVSPIPIPIPSRRLSHMISNSKRQPPSSSSHLSSYIPLTSSPSQGSLSELEGLSSSSSHTPRSNYSVSLSSLPSSSSEKVNSSYLDQSAINNKEEENKEIEIFKEEENRSRNLSESSSEEYCLPPWEFHLYFALCRLIFPPLFTLLAIQFALMTGSIDPSSSSTNAMILVIVVESCSPAAQVVIVTLNQLGDRKIASEMSYMYLIHYLLSIITITFWVTVSMLIFSK